MHLTLRTQLGLRDWMDGACCAPEGGTATDPGNQVNAYTVPEFCRRNRMGVTTAYRANKAGFLKFTRQFGKTLVTAEAEAEFRQIAAEGRLIWPKEMEEDKPGPKERAAGKRGRPRKFGAEPPEAA